MCRVLKISRASYYKWLNREKTAEEIENNELANLIIEYDERFHHILGYRRMTRWINKFNSTNYSKRRVKRIMNLLEIHSVIRKKRPKYIKSTPEITADNLLARDFNASRPNEKWATDVTEFKIIGEKGKLYLSAIIDLYDRSIVAYKISKINNNELVFKTFEIAIDKYPDAKPIFHSDRGFQYTSRVFKTMLKENEMVQSMSRVGRCIDNGPIEGFWGIIKAEMYYLNKFYDEESLRNSIIKYIDFYNNDRPQERYDDLAPMEVRMAAIESIDQIAQYPIKENPRIINYYQNIGQSQRTLQ